MNPTLPNGVSTLADEVLTLGEAAAFLRVPEEGLKQDADSGCLPGRLVAGQWRFVKQALLEWLSSAPANAEVGTSPTRPGDLIRKAMPPGVNDGFLLAIGAFADDKTLEPLVEEIYRDRKRNLVGE